MSGLEFHRSSPLRASQPPQAATSDKPIASPAQPPVAPPETDTQPLVGASDAAGKDSRTQGAEVKFAAFDNDVAFNTPTGSGNGAINSVNRLQLAPELLDSDDLALADDVLPWEDLAMGSLLSQSAEHTPSVEAESYILAQGYDPSQIRDLLRGAALQLDPQAFERSA